VRSSPVAGRPLA